MLFFEINELELMLAGRPRGLLRGGPISSLKRPRPFSFTVNGPSPLKKFLRAPLMNTLYLENMAHFQQYMV